MHYSTAPNGWKRNMLPECPTYGSTGFCSTCIRMGFDFRLVFCPWSIETEQECVGTGLALCRSCIRNNHIHRHTDICPLAGAEAHPFVAAATSAARAEAHHTCSSSQQ